MAEDWELIGVASELVGDTPCYHVRLRRPDGTDKIHVMPQQIIDIRAAEYDIDPTTPEGKQQVLDIILHEQHGPPPEALWKKATIAEAREAHLAQVEDNKTSRVNVIWSGNARAKGKARRFAQGSSAADPAQMLLDHKPDLALRERAKARVLEIRGYLGLEKAPPKPPRVEQPYDPAIRRRSLTVSLLDTPQE